MPISTPDPYRHKKIKGVFIIVLATVITLAYNAFLLYHDRSATPAAPAVTTPTDQPESATYSLADVADRSTPENCWMAAYGNVYDLTEYVADGRHPGGQGSLVSGCGQEVTDSFDRIHSTRAKEFLDQYQIGVLTE